MLPREKLFASGVRELSESELLSLLLRTGNGPSLKELSSSLLKSSGGMAPLLFREPRALLHVQGLGPAKVAILCAVGEILRRHTQGKVKLPRRSIRSSRDAFQHVRHLAREEQEVMSALFLSVRNEVLSSKIIFRGSIESAIASPREILKEALSVNAARLIVAHNHPSKRSDPSAEDIDFTAKLALCAEAIGIPLLDHLIVASAERYYSFADVSRLSGEPSDPASKLPGRSPKRPSPYSGNN